MALLPLTFHDPDGARAEAVLAPIRAGPPAPIFQKVGPAADMRTLSHAADAAMAAAPRRFILRGTFFAGFFPELLVEVWRMWEEFSGSDEAVRGSGVIWDLTSPGGLTKVAPGDTALPTRTPHYWMAAQGRCALVVFD